jgi:hypothetical protein
MRNLVQIKADVSSFRGLSQTKKVTRNDILEVLEYYKDPKKEKENVGAFLDTIESGILSKEGKEKILNDLESYSVSYSRQKQGLAKLG